MFFSAKTLMAKPKDYWISACGQHKNALCVFLNLISFHKWTFRDGKWWWKRSLMSDASWCFVACLCRLLWFWWPRWGKGICSNLMQSGPLPDISRVPITPIIGVITLSYPFISGQFIEGTMSLYLVTIGLGQRSQLLFTSSFLPLRIFRSKRYPPRFGSLSLGFIFPAVLSSESSSPMEVILFSWKGGAIFFGELETSQSCESNVAPPPNITFSSQEIAVASLRPTKVYKGQWWLIISQ